MRSILVFASACVALCTLLAPTAGAQVCYGCAPSADVGVNGNDDCGATPVTQLGAQGDCQGCLFATRVTLNACFPGECGFVGSPIAVCSAIEPCRFNVTWSYYAGCPVVPFYSADDPACLGSSGTPFDGVGPSGIPSTLPRTGAPGAWRPVIAGGAHDLQPTLCGSDCTYTLGIRRESCADITSSVAIKVTCGPCYREVPSGR